VMVNNPSKMNKSAKVSIMLSLMPRSETATGATRQNIELIVMTGIRILWDNIYVFEIKWQPAQKTC